MRSLLAWLLFVSFSCAVCAPRVAHADANAEARVFFEEGNRLLAEALRQRGERRQRGLEQALGQYVSSLRIVRSRNAVFNAGVTLQELGRGDEAFGYYVEYLGMEGITDAERDDVQRRLTELRARVAVLRIESSPPGAEVFVDRRDLAARGVTPVELAVPAGEHVVWLSRRGYTTAETHATAVLGQAVPVTATLVAQPVVLTVRAPAGTTATLAGEPLATNTEQRVAPGEYVLRFERAGAAPVERPLVLEPGSEPIVLDAPALAGGGRLIVRASTASRVALDGTEAGRGTEVSVDAPAGRHTVRIEADGHAPVESAIDLAPEAQLELFAELEALTAGRTNVGNATTLVDVLTVSFAALAIAGTVGSFVQRDAFARLSQDNDTAGTQASFDAATRAAEQLRIVNGLADGLWITTAALGVTSLVLHLVEAPLPQAASRLSIGAQPLAGGAVLSIGGAL